MVQLLEMYEICTLSRSLSSLEIIFGQSSHKALICIMELLFGTYSLFD